MEDSKCGTCKCAGAVELAAQGIWGLMQRTAHVGKAGLQHQPPASALRTCAHVRGPCRQPVELLTLMRTSGLCRGTKARTYFAEAREWPSGACARRCGHPADASGQASCRGLAGRMPLRRLSRREAAGCRGSLAC
jgi:hypothetical protein